MKPQSHASSSSSAAAPRWGSNLPRDILARITRRLDSDVDNLRLRAVCSAWRIAVPLPKPSEFPLPVPFYHASYYNDINPNNRPGSLFLFQSTLLRLSPITNSSDGWLVKVVETKTNTGPPRRFDMLNPLMSSKIKPKKGSLPKGVNLLDCRVREICRSYLLRFVDRDDENVMSESVLTRRVVVLRESVNGDGDGMVVFLLRLFGTLQAWRKGGLKWMMLGGEKDDTTKFEDAMEWKGQCYTVRASGEVVVFNDKLEKVMSVKNGHVCYSYYPGYRNRKCLVVWDGELYMVDKRGDAERCEYDYFMDEFVGYNKPLKLVIMKLNEKGDDWKYAGKLGEATFFVGDDLSFSVRAKEFRGCKANCVYLTDECFVDDGDAAVYGEDAGVYDPGADKMVALAKCPEYARMFWPPPKWLVAQRRSS